MSCWAVAHLGRGIGSALVTHIIATATERGYERLSLETGPGAAFEERLSLETGPGAAFETAHSLYLKFGFEFCGPFADYSPGEFSRFMTLPLDSGDGRTDRVV